MLGAGGTDSFQIHPFLDAPCSSTSAGIANQIMVRPTGLVGSGCGAFSGALF
jgi:hypothetical protein